jgi:DNA invertase Pin-like site-specific DNA recombinase
MLIGYAMVSKADASEKTDLQRDALLAAGVPPNRIYEHLASDAKDKRLGFQACLQVLRPGDTLMHTSSTGSSDAFSSYSSWRRIRRSAESGLRS